VVYWTVMKTPPEPATPRSKAKALA
jgi:hypothetical protein